MHAIEFETDYKNGMIKIPEDYHIKSNSHLKVIILYDDETGDFDTKKFLIDLTTQFKNIKENDLDIESIYNERLDNEERIINFD